MRDHTGSRIAAFILSSTLSFAVQAQSAEKIVIDGSTGVTPLVAALAKAYREQQLKNLLGTWRRAGFSEVT